MARADLLCNLIKTGLMNDIWVLRKATEAIYAAGRDNHHEVFALFFNGFIL
jgi:hypothetical protein